MEGDVMESRKCERNRNEEPLGFKFKLIHECFEKNLNEQLRGDDLTASQMSLLTYLFHNQDHDVSQKELCEGMCIKHPTVIGILDRLEDKGMIRREVNEENHKFRNVLLTQKALDLQMNVKRHHQKTESTLVKGMTADEIAKQRNILDKVYDNMKDI